MLLEEIGLTLACPRYWYFLLYYTGKHGGEVCHQEGVKL